MLWRKIPKETVDDVWQNGARYYSVSSEGSTYMKYKDGVAIIYDSTTHNMKSVYKMSKITSTWVPL